MHWVTNLLQEKESKWSITNLPVIFSGRHPILKMPLVAEAPRPFSSTASLWGLGTKEGCLKITSLNAMAAPSQSQ